MRIHRIAAGLAAVALAFLLGQVSAQDEEKKQPGMPTPPWMKLTKEHAGLKESCGEFEVAGQYWMAPGAPPQPFNATATREMILDGRFLKETFKANWMGQPYEGNLIQGYDTIAKEFVSIWMDSTNPIPQVNRGVEKDGLLTMNGMAPDWMTGQMKKNRQTIKTDDDQVTMEMFEINPDGTGRIMMRLVYRLKR